MKKIFIILLLGLTFVSISIKSTFAWFDCPYSRTNDPYPGQCLLYTDTNSNRICDRSEPEPKIVESNQSIRPAKNFYFWSIFLTLTLYFLHWYTAYKTNLGKKVKWVNQTTFRLIWNLILLISFLPTAITSFLIILNVRGASLVSLHEISGLIFITSAFLHFLGRISYFQNIIKSLTKS